MLFPTIDFAVFFVVVFSASWLLRPWPRAWKLMILAASFVFYGWWDWRFVFLLAASVLLNQAGAVVVGRLVDERARRWAMIGTVVGDVGLLGWFKYYGFFSVNVANGLNRVGVHSPLPVLQVALPVGISFFTFMGISYVVDVHRRLIEPAGWLDAAVYLSFFPHLVAGPIVRGSELLPQLRERQDPKRIDAARAAWLIMAGLAKKVVISSFLSSNIVDPVFAFPHQHSALEILVAVYAYAIQIYADFSGYTDIAIGIALLLGFKFPENFNAPYAATSMQDFWRRWHITLSTWLRDYVYIPLGGNRSGKWRTCLNIFLTMLIGGLWHGAAWTFVAWGAFHGVGQVIGKLRRDHRETVAAATVGGAAAVGGSAAVGRAAAVGGAAGADVAAVPDVAAAAVPVDAMVDAGADARAGAPGPEAPSPPAAAPRPDGPVLPEAAASTTRSAAAAEPDEAWVGRTWVARFVTFNLVCLGWVLFRATSFANALTVLSRLAHPGPAPLVTPLVISAIVVSIASQYVSPGAVARAQRRFSEWAPVTQGVLLAGGLYVITLLGPVGVAPFIYYRF